MKSGTVTMVEPTGHRRHGLQLVVEDFGPGRAFVHPAHEHTFENRTDAPVEFYVVYFVAQGATPAAQRRSHSTRSLRLTAA